MCRYFSNGSGFHPSFMLHCGVIGTTPRPWEARLELMYGRWPGGGAASGGERANSLHASRLQLPIQALSYKTTTWAVQKCHSGRIQNRSGIQCGDKAAVWEGLTLQWRKRKSGGGIRKWWSWPVSPKGWLHFILSYLVLTLNRPGSNYIFSSFITLEWFLNLTAAADGHF